MTPTPLILNGQTYAVHADHLGTPRVITNSSYTEVWRWDSDPFGTTQANEDPDGDGSKLTYNLRFPGQYYDAETGLHYNYFRDYDPGTGRYIESDPIGLAGGLNTYTYVSGNPVNAVDPFGLDETTITVPAPPFVFPKGSPGYDATLNALNALSDVMHDAVDAIKKACSDNDDEPKCHFEREVYYGGPEKTCVYKQKGAFGLITIRQYANKPCPPIDPETCWVDTTGTPEEGRKPSKSPY